MIAPPPGVPARDLRVATRLDDVAAFLYTGASPVQPGVAPDAIAPERVAVLRGRVLATGGEPLPGVTISVLGHPELGATASRADGGFDLAVNGGGPVTLSYDKDGLIPMQRRVEARWNDYAWLPDVVLTAYDTAVTEITGNAAAWQAAQGSVVTDADGARRQAVLFPPGTTATIPLAAGGSEELSTFHVRFTEVTVGDRGPEAMPGDLPPGSAYTYAAEVSVDEARERGVRVHGEEVVFNQAVIGYVQDFLGFPAGTVVPLGYYDSDSDVWIPGQSGLVATLVDSAGGAARLDLDGDGVAEDDAAHDAAGITSGERLQLAALFAAGTTWWRAEMLHFSPWDWNWPVLDWGARPPGGMRGRRVDGKEKMVDCDDVEHLSIIECNNRVALAADGTVYVADRGNRRIRAVDAAGAIRTVVGTGAPTCAGAGGPATEAGLGWPIAIAVGPRGELYFSEQSTGAVRRVETDGTIELFAGMYTSPARQGGGSPRRGADLVPDDWSERDAHPASRRDAPTGSVVLSIGDGDPFPDGTSGRNVDLHGSRGVAVAPDGAVLIAHQQQHAIRRIAALAAKGDGTSITIPAKDGSEYYVFDSAGRHLETRDGVTGNVELSFGYDGAGDLTALADAHGNTVTIERTGGRPAALVAPGGQRTVLTTDDVTGWLTEIRNPEGETVKLTYYDGDAAGLMKTYENARHFVTSYAYDDLGLLVSGEDAVTGGKAFAAGTQGAARTVTRTTAMGRTATHSVEDLGYGETARSVTDGAGNRTAWVESAGGGRTVTFPDGTEMAVTVEPDPRWGLLAPVA
ncbi:MAG: hypothetical protein HYV63_01945, partial [Candidatus Schekmanbacteria bacterium]|nr:hypothetical protein [Candidatus Schekmanbacteria bacterium]